jgi:hypothetical protein
MEHNGHGKLSVLGAAAAAMLRDKQRAQELEEAARIAAERIPLKDALKKLTDQMDAELNRELQTAVERYLGAPVTDAELLRGRMVHVQIPGDEGLTYCVDSTPVLWVGPAAITREGDTMKASRSIQQLLPAVNESDDHEART